MGDIVITNSLLGYHSGTVSIAIVAMQNYDHWFCFMW